MQENNYLKEYKPMMKLKNDDICTNLRDEIIKEG